MHVIGHALEIDIHCVANNIGHFLERRHDLLVILHGFHITCDELHFETHSLNVHGLSSFSGSALEVEFGTFLIIFF